jgi:hypothetical protein
MRDSDNRSKVFRGSSKNAVKVMRETYLKMAENGIVARVEKKVQNML